VHTAPSKELLHEPRGGHDLHSRSCSKVNCQLGRWLTNSSGPSGSGVRISARRVV
jgi:hypothetical protein